MKALLAADPDVRVIHLLRDPRAVVSSRLHTRDMSIVGHYSLTNLSFNSSDAVRREAAVYCRTAVRDIRVRRHLETMYPGRILTLHYEDIAADLDRHAFLVYHFLGIETPHETIVWIRQNDMTTNYAHQSGYLSPLEKWTKRLATADSDAIASDICREYFRLSGYHK